MRWPSQSCCKVPDGQALGGETCRVGLRIHWEMGRRVADTGLGRQDHLRDFGHATIAVVHHSGCALDGHRRPLLSQTRCLPPKAVGHLPLGLTRGRGIILAAGQGDLVRQVLAVLL